ncbi:M28 family peptidase [Cryptosporangium arvum]|uniref:Putative aminopeptidase n=1 Tax=Cryptosporangium arvum DSM 44712 TaxID=927661 RepID=A0A011AEX1_9ACTN|nr:M28 family peptidase [Cryptosporangium arvum]EXG80586.1 putative aminopeptidase [Cryptosporangium arvum DSM 44712]
MRARTRRNRPTRAVGVVTTLVVAALTGVAAHQMTATATPTRAIRPAPAPTTEPTRTPGATPSSTPGTPAATPPAEAGLAAGRALAAQVTVDGVLSHLRAFQQIADGNKGTRASGVGHGYTRSADYVAGHLEAAGYRVTRSKFEFPYFEEVRPTTFRRTAPTTHPYRATIDFQILSYAGSGAVEARVHPVDVTLRPPRASTSGCETADFAGFPRGAIALVQRGSCDFSVKARHAVAAGAAGLIIFNQGNGTGRDRLDAFGGTLQEPFRIPAIGVSYAVGAELAASPARSVRIETETLSETRTTENVLAELPAKRAGRTVMVGAHLDSVPAGPGINDNGSGSAGVLEVALRYAELARTSSTPNTLRFAWWGGEEAGLLGSQHYVDSLTSAERERIALYLNFDMIGSPNYELGVYDGDRGPTGSAAIEKFFQGFLADHGQKSTASEFNGRSDYGPFIAKGIGIPAGGMDTGAEGIKPKSAVAKFGGVPGVAYDPCYHQACDGLGAVKDKDRRDDYRRLARAYGSRLVGNVNVVPLDLISDAIATAVGRYAYDVSDVVGSATPAP